MNLFESGVDGYSQTDFQNDVRDGWKGDARLNNIMAQGDNKRLTMTLNPTVDGISNSTRAEQTGTIWSGQYSLDVQNTDSKRAKGDMMILASNLDSVEHLINFGADDTSTDIYITKNAQGYTWDDGSVTAASRNALVEAGMHRMMQFDLVETRVYDSLANLGSNKKNTYQTKTIWLLNQNYVVFNNNDRNAMGIPEPTTFGSLAAAGAIAVVCRRQRRKA